VTNVGSSIGSSPGSTGVVTVRGTGSSWINSAALDVGFAGTGTVIIEQGGLVSAAALSGGNPTSGVNFNGGTLRITATGAASNKLTLNSGGGALDVPNAGTTFTISSDIAGAGGLTKAGAGTLELTGANAYADDTRVLGGTLSVNGLNFADAADIHLSAGATVNLNFVGTDSINALFFNGVGQATGTWGSLLSAATHKSNFFTGAGLLEVTSFNPGILGNFDEDGDVDGHDFLSWQRGESPEPLSAGDLADWRAHFGTASSVATSVAVPEPCTVSLLVLVAAAGFVSRRTVSRASKLTRV
jgi:T5SS/PEP-CTERM-associated repeat protein/autotransporter-associated beta strand protein